MYKYICIYIYTHMQVRHIIHTMRIVQIHITCRCIRIYTCISTHVFRSAVVRLSSTCMSMFAHLCQAHVGACTCVLYTMHHIPYAIYYIYYLLDTICYIYHLSFAIKAIVCRIRGLWGPNNVATKDASSVASTAQGLGDAGVCQGVCHRSTLRCRTVWVQYNIM